MPAFTYYRQFEEMDCGAACLRMVARAHGREFGLEELRERTRISRSGVSLLGISEGAESVGLQSLALPVSLLQLRKDVPLPCILPWRSDHFIVLYAIDDQGYHVADPDPVVQLTVLSETELLGGWPHSEAATDESMGNVLILEATSSFHNGENSGRYAGGPEYLFGYLRTYRRLFTGLGVGMLLLLLAQIAFPFLLQTLIDRGVILGDTNFILLVVMAQAVLLLSTTLVAAVRNYSLSYIGGRINLSMTGDYLAKLLRLPLAFFDSRSTGDILQRVRDHDRLETKLFRESVGGFLEVLRLFAFGLLLLWWNLAIFTIYVIGTGLSLFWLARKPARYEDLGRLEEKQQIQEGEMLLELVEGAAELKQFGAGLDKRWAWERQRAARYRTSLLASSRGHRQQIVTGFLYQFTALTGSCVAAFAVTKGTMSLGSLVAIQYMLAQLGSPVKSWWAWIENFREGKEALERIGEVHGKQDEYLSGVKNKDQGDFPVDLRLDNLSFHYDFPSAPLVLKKLTVVIPAGRTTAIVGASGSGKSTLLKLLFGYYPPTVGAVTLDGEDRRDVNQAAWRSQVALVSQESYVFTDTVLGNLTMGDHKIDEFRLSNALRITQLKEVIDSLPNRMNTLIGARGMSLSRGQTQRLLLARAIYRKPRYLLLDEATSGLDAFMEVSILDELFAYLAAATIVIVAHRYATFQQADQIVVLEKGSIAEQGKHQDLMAEKKHYFRIVNHQMIIGN